MNNKVTNIAETAPLNFPQTTTNSNSILAYPWSTYVTKDHMTGMEMSTSIKTLAPALAKAQAEMSGALKDAKNPFFKSNYADLNAVREACLPALMRHGFSVLQPTVNVNGQSFVRTLLLHESGEFISSDTLIVVAKQNDPQAQGSGISYARRYGLQSFLNVAAVDDDGESAMGRGRSTPRAEAAPAAVPVTQTVSSTETPAPAAESPKKSGFRKPKASSTPAPAAVPVSDEESWV